MARATRAAATFRHTENSCVWWLEPARVPKKGFAAIEKHAIVSENVWPGERPASVILKQMMSFTMVSAYRHTQTSAICVDGSVAVGGVSSSRSISSSTNTLVHNHDADSGETHMAAVNRNRWKSTMVFSGTVGICGILAGGSRAAARGSCHTETRTDRAEN
eukprot:COSAG02_NODE_470_length_21686_cov_5.095937_15_plen_161_part_00